MGEGEGEGEETRRDKSWISFSWGGGEGVIKVSKGNVKEKEM